MLRCAANFHRMDSLGSTGSRLENKSPFFHKWAENQIQPWALERKNWLFAGSLRSGQRAAAIMNLIQSARLNGHEPSAYLNDVLTRLPTQRASEITQPPPHSWSTP